LPDPERPSKPTLLRIIAGLIAPSSGEAKCRGDTIVGPPHGVSAGPVKLAAKVTARVPRKTHRRRRFD